jgi:two-component system, cell cycle response regulator DivK
MENTPVTPKTPPINILVAEDEQINYMLVELLLQPFNCRIIPASNGREAVDFCSSDNGIDLVIMDMKMPVLDGFDATRMIKKLRPELPVIAVSAYAFYDDEEKALAAGCDDFLSKPFEKSELLRTLSRHICLY